MEISPPQAKTVPYTFTHLSHTLTDEYAWLQDKNDPAVIAHLEAENAYARAFLSGSAALQETLYQELRARLKEDDASVQEVYGAYAYYWRMLPGQQYRLFCRRRDEAGAPEEILLDENALAVGHTYCQVRVFEPSPDGSRLAYSVDTTGALVFDLYVKDLTTGALLRGPIPDTAWTAAWANDETLFYTVFDASHRPYQLYRLNVSEPGVQPGIPTPGAISGSPVYHETDDAFMLTVQRSKSGEYLFVAVNSASTSEVRTLPTRQPAAPLCLVEPRRPWVEYYLEHAAAAQPGDPGVFWIRTNLDAENFRLVSAPAADPAQANWRSVLPHRPDVLVEDVQALRDCLVVFERRAGLKQLRLSAPDGLSDVRYASFPDPVYTFRPADNKEYASPALRIFYSSLVTPESTVDIDLASGTWQVKKVQEIPSGYDPAQYASERISAVAPDGAQVPISLVYRKGPDGKRPAQAQPLLLDGYGSYGFSREPGFTPNRLSLLDRGFVYALAHIRGGSELGRAWYEQGRLMNKKNTFSDFIACAEHLIAQGYTAADRLAIIGGSAGGLLMSAVANLRPELFKAIVALVPFTKGAT